jgi:hypothetical protein
MARGRRTRLSPCATSKLPKRTIRDEIAPRPHRLWWTNIPFAFTAFRLFTLDDRPARTWVEIALGQSEAKKVCSAAVCLEDRPAEAPMGIERNRRGYEVRSSSETPAMATWPSG